MFSNKTDYLSSINCLFLSVATSLTSAVLGLFILSFSVTTIAQEDPSCSNTGDCLRSKSRHMTDEQIQESLELFRNFEQSDVREKVMVAAKSRQEKRETTPLPEDVARKKFTSVELSERENMTSEDFHSNWTSKQEAQTQYLRERLEEQQSENLSSEVASKVGSIVNGKYRTTIFFVNDMNFPAKLVNHDVFYQDRSLEFSNKWKDTIFAYYLGEQHQAYNPELISVNKSVGLKILVTGSDDLGTILDGKAVKRLTHVASPIGGIETSLPYTKRTKDHATPK